MLISACDRPDFPASCTPSDGKVRVCVHLEIPMRHLVQLPPFLTVRSNLIFSRAQLYHILFSGFWGPMTPPFPLPRYSQHPCSALPLMATPNPLIFHFYRLPRRRFLNTHLIMPHCYISETLYHSSTMKTRSINHQKCLGTIM